MIIFQFFRLGLVPRMITTNTNFLSNYDKVLSLDYKYIPITVVTVFQVLYMPRCIIGKIWAPM